MSIGSVILYNFRYIAFIIPKESTKTIPLLLYKRRWSLRSQQDHRPPTSPPPHQNFIEEKIRTNATLEPSKETSYPQKMHEKSEKEREILKALKGLEAAREWKPISEEGPPLKKHPYST